MIGGRRARTNVLRTGCGLGAGRAGAKFDRPRKSARGLVETNPVDASLWIAVISVIVAVLAIVASVWAARRYGTRRRKLLFEWSAAPLIPETRGDASPRLVVTYRDFEVKDPYLLTLRLVNVGPSDVATSHFDGGRDLVIELGCTLFGLLGSPGGDGNLTTVTTAVGSDGPISLRPGLFRQGSAWSVDVVVSGRPDPRVNSPLIDTDVVDPPTYRKQLARSLATVAADAALSTLPSGRAVRSTVSASLDPPPRPGGRFGNSHWAGEDV
jgi:hypothetical protein